MSSPLTLCIPTACAERCDSGSRVQRAHCRPWAPRAHVADVFARRLSCWRSQGLSFGSSEHTTSHLLEIGWQSQYLGQADHSSILVGPYLWSSPTPGVIETRHIAFEGLEMPAPADPAAVLGAIYGDYLTPPAAPDQVTHHLMTALWID